MTDNHSADEPAGAGAEFISGTQVPPAFPPLASTPAASSLLVTPPSTTPPAAPPATSVSSPGPRTVGRRTVVMSAVLAAVLASASTAAVVTIETSGRSASPSSNTGAADLTSSTTSNDPTAVIARANKSVVTIATSSSGTLGGSSGGVGSGIIVSSNGLILTNAHVVAGADQLVVQLPDGRQLPATVVHADSAADLATIKVDATGLGSPLGEYSDTVTSGVLSATNRSITVSGERRGQSEDLSGLLQTDAAINPGNSGGPLIDGNGTVIGIVTAGSSNAEGIGFAIPINAAKGLIASSNA